MTSLQPPEPRAAFKAEREGAEIQTGKARGCICAPGYCTASEHSNLRIASVISHSSSYHIRDCLGDPCVDSRSRSLSRSTPEVSVCSTRVCETGRAIGERTPRTRESLAFAGSTLLALVVTSKISYARRRSCRVVLSPPYLVLGRSSSSRCPSRSITLVSRT